MSLDAVACHSVPFCTFSASRFWLALAYLSGVENHAEKSSPRTF